MSREAIRLDLSALSDEELVAAAKRDVADAFPELLRRYRRRLRFLSSAFFITGGDVDDLLQEATIGLFKAVRDYRIDRGSFRGFMDLCVRRQIITQVIASRRQRQRVLNESISLDAPIGFDRATTMHDRIAADMDDPLERAEEIEFVDRLARLCSPFERAVLSMYSAGYSFLEMGALCGKNYKGIDNAVWRIKLKAKRVKELLHSADLSGEDKVG